VIFKLKFLQLTAPVALQTETSSRT